MLHSLLKNLAIFSAIKSMGLTGLVHLFANFCKQVANANKCCKPNDFFHVSSMNTRANERKDRLLFFL